jgi:hypothetical protein
VPDSFTVGDVSALAASGDDPRLRRARDRALHGEITQYLAGVPVLLERYEDSPADARALLDAAIDARRLGWGVELPVAFIADAAQGYLTQAEWDRYGECWPSSALDDTDEHRGGFPGPLTRVRARRTPGEPMPTSRLVCRLADALEQHGTRSRAGTFPAESFWTASLVHADPSTLIALAENARTRGLYRTQVQLFATAAQSTATAATALVDSSVVFTVGALGEAACWAAQVVPLSDPGPLAGFLWILRMKIQEEAVAALLARKPGCRAELSDSAGVAELVSKLQDCSDYGPFPEPVRVAAATELATLLSRHPAWSAGAATPEAIAQFVNTLRATGPGASSSERRPLPRPGPDRGGAREEDVLETAESLAARIGQLAEEEGDDQALLDLLAGEPSRRVSVTDAGGVAHLLKELESLARRRVFTRISDLSWSEGATLLVDRRPWEHVSLTDPAGVALLLRWLDFTHHCWTSSPEDFVGWLEQSQDPVYLRLRGQQLRDPQANSGYWARLGLGTRHAQRAHYPRSRGRLHRRARCRHHPGHPVLRELRLSPARGPGGSGPDPGEEPGRQRPPGRRRPLLQ